MMTEEGMDEGVTEMTRADESVIVIVIQMMMTGRENPLEREKIKNQVVMTKKEKEDIEMIVTMIPNIGKERVHVEMRAQTEKERVKKKEVDQKMIPKDQENRKKIVKGKKHILMILNFQNQKLVIQNLRVVGLNQILPVVEKRAFLKFLALHGL